MRKTTLFLATAGAALAMAFAAKGQVIGSYDNFDCFNDTGETAEGFEIDVEDVNVSDLSREFPSNFSTTPWVIRYGLPTVTAYDFTASSPDPQHSFDAGHKGVLITWAAKWAGGMWVADYGSQQYTNGQGQTVPAGNGTPYVASPTYTSGESCWFYGLGNAYPTSGCDHFGISFNYGINPGKMTYHWKIPDPANVGQLVNGTLEASLPPSPNLAPNPPVAGKPPVIHAVAEAPIDNQDPIVHPDRQWGDAYWVKTTTLFSPKQAVLDDLQKKQVEQAKTNKTVTWAMLQRAPNGQPGERAEVENNAIPKGNVQVTKEYEYFKFAGPYTKDTHEVLCGVVALKLAGDCTKPYTKTYTVKDPSTGKTLTVTHGDKGAYIGAHMNAFDVQ